MDYPVRIQTIVCTEGINLKDPLVALIGSLSDDDPKRVAQGQSRVVDVPDDLQDLIFRLTQSPLRVSNLDRDHDLRSGNVRLALQSGLVTVSTQRPSIWSLSGTKLGQVRPLQSCSETTVISKAGGPTLPASPLAQYLWKYMGRDAILGDTFSRYCVGNDVDPREAALPATNELWNLVAHEMLRLDIPSGRPAVHYGIFSGEGIKYSAKYNRLFRGSAS